MGKQNFEVTSGHITGNIQIPEGPDWVHDSVFYQIYPQTFKDSNGDGIGDIQGIIEKLDYVKSIGADGIWLSPFFQSPFYDGGYDISDYYKVAPRYGTLEDVKTLFEEAHKRGLKVIFDFVAGHTSIEHPWFQESGKQDKNKYSDWYIWTDNVFKSLPEPIKDKFIIGYSARNGNYMRNYFWSQAALNYGFADPDPDYSWQLPADHPSVLDMVNEMKNVVRFWMDLGADGFRADMAGALVKSYQGEGNEQFSSNTENATKEFWTDIRNILDKEYPGSFMVSEWSHPTAAIDSKFHADFYHWFDGYNDLVLKESWRILNGFSEGHSFFDREGKGNITRFLEGYLEHYNNVRSKGYVCLPLGNHDIARLNNKRTTEELEMIFAFLLTMPGIPFIYYGNEIGMRQLDGLPYVEGAYAARSGARTPMQWTKEKNAGFSSAESQKLYLPIDGAEDYPNVAEQENDPESLLNCVRRLIQMKKEQKTLRAYAEFTVLYAKENTYPFIYARASGEEALLIIMNPSSEDKTAGFTANLDTAEKELISGSEAEITRNGNDFTVKIPGLSYSIYKCTVFKSC